MLLMIDNYDSFTYNLVQAFAAMGASVAVYRNDAITVAESAALEPTHLVISPGPGRPEAAGVSLAMIGAWAGKVPILGVCLGHQSIVQQHGGEIVRAERLMHGKTSPILHQGFGVLRGILVNGTDEAMAYIQSIPVTDENGRARTFYTSMVAGEILERGVEEAKAWVATISDPELQGGAISRVAKCRASTSWASCSSSI